MDIVFHVADRSGHNKKQICLHFLERRFDGYKVEFPRRMARSSEKIDRFVAPWGKQLPLIMNLTGESLIHFLGFPNTIQNVAC